MKINIIVSMLLYIVCDIRLYLVGFFVCIFLFYYYLKIINMKRRNYIFDRVVFILLVRF